MSYLGLYVQPARVHVLDRYVTLIDEPSSRRWPKATAQLVISLTQLLFTFPSSDVTAVEFDRDVISPLGWQHEHMKELIVYKRENGEQL